MLTDIVVSVGSGLATRPSRPAGGFLSSSRKGDPHGDRDDWRRSRSCRPSRSGAPQGPATRPASPYRSGRGAPASPRVSGPGSRPSSRRASAPPARKPPGSRAALGGTTSQSQSARIAARCCFNRRYEPRMRLDVRRHVERRDRLQPEPPVGARSLAILAAKNSRNRSTAAGPASNDRRRPRDRGRVGRRDLPAGRQPGTRASSRPLPPCRRAPRSARESPVSVWASADSLPRPPSPRRPHFDPARPSRPRRGLDRHRDPVPGEPRAVRSALDTGRPSRAR